MSQSLFDTIVIGAGPAGLTAGLFSGLYGLNSLVIGKTIGGELKLAPMIFDYPGVRAIKGEAWLNNMLEQVKEAGTQIIENQVTNIQKDESKEKLNFTVSVKNQQFTTQTIIFAVGNKKRRPNYTGSDLAKSIGVDVTADGFISFQTNLQTNIPGVFVAGNVLKYPQSLEQLLDSTAQGAKAAALVFEYLKNQKAPIIWGKATIPNK